MTTYYSNGKLLITGEYVVLDGALALALPTKFGQSLSIEPIEERKIRWTALDHQEKQWFRQEFRFTGSELQEAEGNASPEVVQDLKKILQEAHSLNPAIFSEDKGFKVTTQLDFPRDWGLGSSSTLINNIAQWFGIDAYKLLESTFSGSGYDIAAAQSDVPLTFQKTRSGNSVLASSFDPEFREELFFVYLNQKQNSRSSIAHYKDQPKDLLEETVTKISAVTQSIITCTTLTEFKLLLEIHETLISKIINTPKIKTTLFPDFPGAIKSLGGWGGDFVLATGGKQEKEYFRGKGYGTILSYEEMVK